MVLTIISVSSLLVIGTLSYLYYKKDNECKDLSAKSEALKTFSDTSAKVILEQKEKLDKMSAHVVDLVNKISQLGQKIETYETANAKVIAKEVAPSVAVEQTKKPRGRRRKPNKQ